MLGIAPMPTTCSGTGAGPLKPGGGCVYTKSPPYRIPTVSPTWSPRSLATAELGTISSGERGSSIRPRRIFGRLMENPKRPSRLTMGNTFPGFVWPGINRLPCARVILPLSRTCGRAATRFSTRSTAAGSRPETSTTTSMALSARRNRGYAVSVRRAPAAAAMTTPPITPTISASESTAA